MSESDSAYFFILHQIEFDFDLDHDDLLQAAKQLILECKCKSGCPSCVGPVLEVGELGKDSALKLLGCIL